MVGGDREVFEKVTPLFEVRILFLVDRSAWETTSAIWALLVAVSTRRCATRSSLPLIWCSLEQTVTNRSEFVRVFSTDIRLV